MQNLENLDVFEILITQKLLKCLKDPFVRSALIFMLCLPEIPIPIFPRNPNTHDRFVNSTIKWFCYTIMSLIK